MREIKFRAWDNHNHAMIPIRNELKAFQGWEIMQYTGLKDKNGVEIYEGDIVRYESYRTFIDKVEYSNSGFNPFAESYFGDGIGTAEDMEVIGNIYENPELLKK